MPQYFIYLVYIILGIIQSRYYLIKVYSRIEDVIKDNPTFKAQTIRGCCNGNKKTAYSYIWRYIDDNGNVKYKI